MPFGVVHISKVLDVYGQALKEQCYDNIRVSKSSWDSTFCAVNPKFLAIIVESAGGGAFIVLPHNKVGCIPADHPLVGGHKGPVLDIAWCPHNDNVIASGSEDCIKVWQIPDGGLSRTLTEPVVDLVFCQRRVGLVLWHPTAQNVLLTAGSDNQMAILNVGTGEVLITLDCHPDLIYSASWNRDGSKLVTTCRDKKIRIIDPRKGVVNSGALVHEGSKASRAIFLNGMVFTTGFSAMSERQYSLRFPDELDDPLVTVKIDTSDGVMFPFFDPDTNMIYLWGKGDSVIRYFEFTRVRPCVHYINSFQTADPQIGIGIMPKRGCDVATCEIAKFYMLNNSGLCQAVSMIVPRKSELFQEDLYPDTASDEASLTADEWAAGKNAWPCTMSLKGVYVSGRTKKANALAGAKEKERDRSPPTEEKRDDSQCATPASATPPPAVSAVIENQQSDVMDEIRKLKSVIEKQENRIRALEATVKAAPSPQPSPQPSLQPNHDMAISPGILAQQCHNNPFQRIYNDTSCAPQRYPRRVRVSLFPRDFLNFPG